MGEREKKYVHCLNATLTATERTLCCIVENYQTPEGLKVPEVLQPFVGVDFIPYKVKVKRDNKKVGARHVTVHRCAMHLGSDYLVRLHPCACQFLQDPRGAAAAPNAKPTK